MYSNGSALESGVVLSPDILRRLGHPDPRTVPPQISMQISRSGFPDDRIRFELPVAGLVGDLGRSGVRIPLKQMQAIRRFQFFGSEAMATPATNSEIEINAIHLMIPAQHTVEATLADLRQIDPGFQLASTWFERGKQLSLLSTALKMAAPLMTLLVIFNGIVLAILAREKVKADRQRLCLMRLAGASFNTIMAWYVLPLTTICGIATVAGISLAALVFQFQILPVLETAVESKLSVPVPYVALTVVILSAAIGFHGLATYRQTRLRGLESGLVA